jgi:hypothetical protein
VGSAERSRHRNVTVPGLVRAGKLNEAEWTHYAILAALSMPLGSLVTFRTPNSEIRGPAHRLELIQVRTVGFARRFGESGPDMRFD